MTSQGEDSLRLDVLTRRTGILRRLCEDSAYKRDLVDELDLSRSTVNRAVSELEDAGFVREIDEGVTATLAGRLAIRRLSTFQAELGDLVAAEDVVDPLPADASLTNDVLVGSDPMLASDLTPYRPLEHIHEELTDAVRYRALLPALDDTRHVRLLYEHVVAGGREADLVVTPSVFELLQEEFSQRVAAMADCEGFRVRVTEEVPPFGLMLFEENTTVAVVVYTDSGTVHGTLVNDTPTACAWAADRYETVAETATDRTDELVADDSGGPLADSLAGGGQSLPVPLEREGFVHLDLAYFGDEPVADPVTAWRAGLSLAEVHVGYAVERAHQRVTDDGRGTETAGEGSTETALTERLRSALVAGTDCVVLGPPGVGKSTVCKQVACEWYDDDRGPVFYREGGRGRPFEAVGDLVEAVEGRDGHALVVVEDAVRPAANGIFEAISRLDDRDDVSFLLDSRESEWLDPADNVSLPDLEVTTVPPLTERDCERLVDHFERTVGRETEVPVERLWQEVREERPREDAASGMLLLLHRLSTYADPLSEGQTSLETKVATLAAELVDDEMALSVAILANTLNAAGMSVDRDALYAVADPAEFDAVETALDWLEGVVLFPRPDGTYRPVHESWSVTFLAQLPEVVGESTAAEQFGTAVTALLALADDAERRERVTARVEEAPTVAAIREDPQAWVRDAVVSLAELGRKRPKLAPLFGDGERDTVTLPETCPEATVLEWPARLGRLFLAGGYYDRAERAFERLSGTRDPERLLGLAKVANARSDYDVAVERAEDCLAQVARDDTALRARAKLSLGKAKMRLDDYEPAAENFRAAIEAFETLGDRQGVGTTWRFLGRVAMLRGEFDRAREYFERSRTIARECGDRRGEASTLNNLGETARYQGEYDRAREYHEESLAIRRALGDRQGEGHSLGNLGIIAAIGAEYDRAREYFEESLAVKRDLGDRQGVANTLNNLGNVARREGAYDRAREYFEESLEIKRDLGDREGVASTLNNLGELAMLRGAYDRASEYFEESIEINREVGGRQRRATALSNLGELRRREGNADRARTRLETSIDLGREVGDAYTVARSQRSLGELARTSGEDDRAREYFDRAADAAADGGERLDVAKIELSRGRLAVEQGALDRARDRATEARETFEEIGADPWEARSRTLLGRVAAESGDVETAREHWQAALETFEAVDAVPDVLATLRYLLETAAETTDGTAQRWRERLESRLADAPDAVADQYRESLDDHLARE